MKYLVVLDHVGLKKIHSVVARIAEKNYQVVDVMDMLGMIVIESDHMPQLNDIPEIDSISEDFDMSL